VLLALFLWTPAAYAAPGAATRLKAFEAQLEAHASATQVLQAWCDVHAPGTRVIAHQVQSESLAPSEEARAALKIEPGEAVRYRRVQLKCGDLVLSNADNWYLPGKLTRAMNDTLEKTETPFGAAVAGLHFRRRNLTTRFLPLRGPSVLTHSALLTTDRGQPFSFVVETYTRAILGR
jgi:chorismate-pyruvate lyase